VSANLAKLQNLLFGSFEEISFLDLVVLWQGLICQPVRPVVAMPPFELIQGLSLRPLHMALDLGNAVNNLMGNLPKPREFVAVAGSCGIGGLKSLHQGLTIHDKMHLLTWGSEGLHHEQCQMFSTDCGARVSFRYGHAGCPSATCGVDLKYRTSGNGQIWVIDVLARTVAIEVPGCVPLKIGGVDLFSVNCQPEWFRGCVRSWQADKQVL
jgi:hypothetical protein